MCLHHFTFICQNLCIKKKKHTHTQKKKLPMFGFSQNSGLTLVSLARSRTRGERFCPPSSANSRYGNRDPHGRGRAARPCESSSSVCTSVGTEVLFGLTTFQRRMFWQCSRGAEETRCAWPPRRARTSPPRALIRSARPSWPSPPRGMGAPTGAVSALRSQKHLVMEDNGAPEMSPHPGGLASDQSPKSSERNEPSYQTGRTEELLQSERRTGEQTWGAQGREKSGEEEAALLLEPPVELGGVQAAWTLMPRHRTPPSRH